MPTLVLRHIAGSDPPQLQVMEPSGKATEPRPVPPADQFPVEGRPHSHLMRELAWYLEEFLGYPFPPETDHAERVLAALKVWGEQAFAALFGDRSGGGMLERATRGGHALMRLQLWSDAPRVLSWPWEALQDPLAGPLGQLVQIERRLDRVGDPVALSPELPKDGVNILLVTARPYEGDVHYRSISRPLVELIRARKLPADVHVLRPPTFDRLREHLHERPNHYHLLHFDGHGAYAPGGSGGSAHADGSPGHAFQVREGRLVFEDADGKPAEITAEQLGPLLREHAVPVVVLNACQSGMLGEEAESAFASVAASLLQAGTRSVVAMAYSLYVSAAQQFLPAFYRRLFESGSVAEGARAGRQEMFAHPDRVCVRGKFPLRDWLVPVLYQQEDVDLSFAQAAAPKPAETVEQEKPIELGGEASPYGFVGRDGAILRLERAMRRRPAAILVHGLGGVGKTTLARGFVEWLRDTEGLRLGCLWFTFQEIRSTEFILNRIGDRFVGPQFATLDRERKIEVLGEILKENPLLLVWDNFEVVAGIPGTEVAPTLAEDDRQDLLALLKRLRGGKTKVLITSRSEEAWLGEERRRVALGGLEGEERWEYCERIVEDLGIEVSRDDKDLVKLMDLLGGHPLAMRVVLRELEGRTAEALIQVLQTNLGELDGEASVEQAKLYATLRFVEEGLPADLKPLLIPLALHERFVDADYLEAMAKQVDAGWTRARIDTLFGALTTAGLLRDRGRSIYEMHPVLTGYLRSTALRVASEKARESWAGAFVGFMADFADYLTPRPLHEQRGPFAIHRANFYSALAEAERLGLVPGQAALLQSVAFYAQNTRSFAEAALHFTALSEVYKNSGDEIGEASTYHHIGAVACEQRDFIAAEEWHRKSLDIRERLGDKGRVALSYHELGLVAQEQHDFAAADRWLRRSLEIEERLGNESTSAITYYQLGIVALEQSDLGAAEAWYRKSLKIFERIGDERGAAMAYHELGAGAYLQHNLTAAKGWYEKSLQIKLRVGNEYGAAMTCYQLGMLAQEERDFGSAEKWYLKALEIQEKLADEHSAASTYGQLGILAGLQERYEEAGRWLLRAIATFVRTNDPNRARQNAQNYSLSFSLADEPTRETLHAMWREAGLGEIPAEATEPEGEQGTT